jgi:DNA polymerase III alpha subunit
MNFIDNFTEYKEAVLPGVRLPEIKIEQKYYDALDLSSDADNFSFLKKLCDYKLKEKNLHSQEYTDRLQMELSIFEELGFVDYVLLNWDILNFCHENKIPTGPGRGSAAGSLVLFLIDVTKVDPIKYGLFFERFVSKSRAKKIIKGDITYLDGSLLPDVDNDISYDRRAEVIKYIEEKHFGKTSKILTLNTLSSKLCIKECGKIVGNYSESEVNEVSDNIPKMFGKVFPLEKAYKESEKFKAWADNNPHILEIAKKIEGLNKNTGVHPSGIAISFYNIEDICPVQKTSDGDLVSGYDMNYVAELMVKFDVLGLRTLTVINEVCKMLNMQMTSIDPEDEFIFHNLQNLKTPQGLFQIEADTNFKVCKKVSPKNLEQLSAVIAIARPGALDFADQYATYSATNTAQVVHDFFKEELSYTGGIPLYQEQLMKMAVRLGFTLDESEQLRRATAKKKIDQMPAWQGKIRKKVEDQKLDTTIGDVLWKVAEDSANYSFNKCLLPETVVESESGFKCLNNIQKGERVLAYDVDNDKNHFVEVLNIHENEVDVYEIEMEDGTKITCSMDHKFLCKDKKMHTLKDIVSKNSEIMCKSMRTQKIISIKRVGKRKTLDLEVNHKDHNFYAEGLVSSNSHSISYSILAAWTTYLKFKYPQEFFLALLKLSKYEPDSHNEINKISKELIHFDIQLLPPDLAKSALDFKIEGNNIRFGLNSIKGVSEKTLQALENFRETNTPNKFDIFIAAKQAGINIGLLSSLIQAGTLSSYTNRRSRLVLEAQSFNILTDNEKSFVYKIGHKHDYDILTIISECAFKNSATNEKGKPFMSDKRKQTFKKKYDEYKKIYEQNKNYEKFANWVFENKLLGYTPSIRLKTVFKDSEHTFTDCLEFDSTLKNDKIRMIGVIDDIYKGKTKKNNKTFYRFQLKDEVGKVSAMFLDSGNQAKLTEYIEDGLKIPEKEDIVIFTGRKGDDILWVDNIGILNDKIYMKLSDIE